MTSRYIKQIHNSNESNQIKEHGVLGSWGSTVTFYRKKNIMWVAVCKAKRVIEIMMLALVSGGKQNELLLTPWNA